jgi:hypothetical protein
MQGAVVKTKDVLRSGYTSLSRLVDLAKPSGSSQIGAIQSACSHLVPFLNEMASGNTHSVTIAGNDYPFVFRGLITGGDCEFSTSLYGISSFACSCHGCTRKRSSWLVLGRLVQPENERSLALDKRAHDHMAAHILGNESLVRKSQDSDAFELKVCQATLRQHLKAIRDSPEVAGL